MPSFPRSSRTWLPSFFHLKFFSHQHSISFLKPKSNLTHPLFHLTGTLFSKAPRTMCLWPPHWLFTLHSVLSSLLLSFCVHPSTETCLVNITKDSNVVRPSSFFSIIIFLDRSLDESLHPLWSMFCCHPTHILIYPKCSGWVSEMRFWCTNFLLFFSSLTGSFLNWFVESSSSQSLKFVVQRQMLHLVFNLTTLTL